MGRRVKEEERRGWCRKGKGEINYLGRRDRSATEDGGTTTADFVKRD